MDKVKEKIERWKATAELFLNNNVSVYIKDTSDNIYFADILLIGENTISIKCFSPISRAGMKFNIYWTLISKFEEYKPQ